MSENENIEFLTTTMIRELRDESEQYGDHETVELCEEALDVACPDIWQEVADVINDARSMIADYYTRSIDDYEPPFVVVDLSEVTLS